MPAIAPLENSTVMARLATVIASRVRSIAGVSGSARTWTQRVAVAAILAGLPMTAGAVSPDIALGRWASQTRGGVVEITLCGMSICGRLVASRDAREDLHQRDVHNPQPALRDRELAGLVMLYDFIRADDGWARGVIYNPDDGKTYHARVTPIDQDHLRVRGCVFIPICQSQVWTRLH